MRNKAPNTAASGATMKTDKSQKQKMKKYADRKNSALSAKRKIGDKRPRFNTGQQRIKSILNTSHRRLSYMYK